MRRLVKSFALIAAVTLGLLLLAGCGKNSITGKYCAVHDDTMYDDLYIELRDDKTYGTDFYVKSLMGEGTYEISGSDITFTFSYPWYSDNAGDEGTATGTISGDLITYGGITYKKQA